MAKPISETSLIKWIGFSLIFMLLMFSQEFGQIYIAMVIVWFIFWFTDKFLFDRQIKFPIEQSTNGRLESIVIVLISYAIFLLVTSLLMTTFLPNTLPSGSVLEIIKMMGTGIVQASGPILRDSKILMVIGWGLLIPVVETVLFNGKIFEALYDFLKAKGFDLRSRKLNILPILLIIIGAVSALYHLTSKNMQSIPLIVTFLFFTISGILVVWKGHLREAILLHVLGNSIAVLSQIGVI